MPTGHSPLVQRMLLALPDLSFGDQVHAVYVNRLQGALPGNYSRLLGTGPSFRSIFFPAWQPGELAGRVNGATGLNDQWWSDFSVAVLCQSMWYLTSSLKPHLLKDDIDAAVNAANAELRRRSARTYSLALARFFPPFRHELNAVTDRPAALAEYRRALVESVGMHRIWYSTGAWKNPDWEMFNHVAKLLALGAADGEIDATINELAAAGLPMPPGVTVRTWRSYSSYLASRPAVDHTDIDAAAHAAILETTYLFGMGEEPPIARPEGNSYEFTALEQPGTRFRRAPSGGSCFSSETHVLMEDGGSVPICELRPGARVATPRGVREVAFVSTPLRLDRPLHALNGMRFGFTATHPFANADCGPAMLCVDTAEARRLVPTLAHAGVGALTEGANVLELGAPDGTKAQPLLVRSLAPHTPADEGNPYVYDLVLRPDEGGFPPYWAGDGARFVLVAPELGGPDAMPHAAAALVTALKRAMPALARALAGEFVPSASAARIAATAHTPGGEGSALLERLTRFSAERLSGAVAEAAGRSGGKQAIGATPRDDASSPASAALLASLHEFLDSAGELSGAENVLFGALFETLASRLVDELETAAVMGWRVFGEEAGGIAAVSVGGLLLHAGHALPPGEHLKAVVEVVAQDVVRETHALRSGFGREGTAFAHYFDQVVYFGTPSAGARLDFTFYRQGARIPIFAACAYLPNLTEPYRHFRLPVEAGDRTVRGELHVDLRCITPQAAARELDARSRWDATARTAFTEALGEALGEILTERAVHPTLA